MQDDGIRISKQASSPDHLSWCRFIRDRRWSAKQKRALIAHYQTPAMVLAASQEQLSLFVDGRQRNCSSLVDDADISRDIEWLSADRHHLVTILDEHYPSLLREISDPPLAFFAIGDIDLLKEPQVAMVGSRKPTPIGDKVARSLSANLSALGVVVTSGMALGVDAAAHHGAFTGGGSSIAVLGNGLDTVYPARHRDLFEKLSCDGLLVSEFPLGVKPSRYTFPQRNRIVSGLSYGVIIVEAAERSGTLITARLAMEQNRDVMVVPGSSLSAQYQGSHRLLQQGAALVTCCDDVIQCLSLPLSAFLGEGSCSTRKKPEVSNRVDNVQHSLLQYISSESTSVDDIIQSSQLTSAQVSSMLLELELRGAVAIASDGGYVNLS